MNPIRDLVYSLLETSFYRWTIEDKPDDLVQGRPKPDLKLFLDAPPEIEVRNIDDHGLKLKITSTDPRSTDVLIFNPWKENSSNIKDVGYWTNEYLHFLGVGNGHLCSDIRLEPQETWESNHVIEVVNEEYEKKINALGELLDNPLNLFKETCKKTNTYFNTSK